MATSLKTLNALFAKLGLPKAQDLIGRKYSFSANKNAEVGYQIEVGMIGRILYDIENAEIQIIPVSYSRSSYETLHIGITVDLEDEKSFGYTERTFRTTDDLAAQDSCQSSVPGTFRLLK